MGDFKEADVFRFEWKDGAEPIIGRYSGIAIVTKSGTLMDTYWGIKSSDGHVIKAESVDLDFIGNLKDFDQAGYAQIEHYNPEDVLNIQHANSPRHPTLKHVFIRKGATEKRCRIRARLVDELVTAQKKAASAHRFMEFARERLERFDHQKEAPAHD